MGRRDGWTVSAHVGRPVPLGVETTQVAAVAMTARMRAEDLARIPFSFPTYAGVVGRAAYVAVRRLGMEADGPPYEP